MKTILNIFKFLALGCWILLAGTVQAAITLTNPNWTPVNYLIASNPLIGPSRKSLANNVAYRWFNKNVWRSKPVTFTEGVSAPRETQKTFFTACQAFAKTFLSSVRIGFKQQATEMPAYSYFIGWLLRNAGNSYPGPATLDKSKVIMSKGSLQQPSDIAVAAVAGEKIGVSWTDDSGTGNALATDCLMVVWYNETQAIGGSELTGTVKRSTESFEEVCPGAVASDHLLVWVFFTSADGGLVSDSGVYTEITVLT